MINKAEAAYALMALSFVTQKTLMDDEKAFKFFEDLLGKTKPNFSPIKPNIYQLIEYARLGERKLEKELSDFKNDYTK